jgi:hypothetical protein
VEVRLGGHIRQLTGDLDVFRGIRALMFDRAGWALITQYLSLVPATPVRT